MISSENIQETLIEKCQKNTFKDFENFEKKFNEFSFGEDSDHQKKINKIIHKSQENKLKTYELCEKGNKFEKIFKASIKSKLIFPSILEWFSAIKNYTYKEILSNFFAGFLVGKKLVQI